MKLSALEVVCVLFANAVAAAGFIGAVSALVLTL